MQVHDKNRRRKLIMFFGIIALVAAAGIGLQLRAAWALKDGAREGAVVTVGVVKAGKGAPTEEVVLPGNVEAWHQATIFARVNGYLKDWKTPMGTPVKQGDLLAEIETPETDAQLRQAQADLKTAQANNQLAQSTAKRWKELLKTDSVSKQEAEEKIAAANANEAAVASASANVQHLEELESFKNVVAPFDGMITARLTDNGALINAGSEQMQAPLFKIVQADRLRIYVRVPESYSGSITPDLTAELHFTEHPGKAYPVKLIKSAEELDPATRTLLIEFGADNKDGELMSGGYTDVHIKFPSQGDAVRLPVNTLIFRAQGLQLATVGPDNKVVLKTVTMGRDFGNTVEISAGIAPDDQVVINPPDSLANGQEVRIAVPQEKKDDAKKDEPKKDEPKADDSKKDAPKPEDKPETKDEKKS